MWTIKWKNKKTGDTGSGLYLHDRDVAQKISDISEAQNPQYERWVAEEEP